MKHNPVGTTSTKGIEAPFSNFLFNFFCIVDSKKVCQGFFYRYRNPSYRIRAGFANCRLPEEGEGKRREGEGVLKYSYRGLPYDVEPGRPGTNNGSVDSIFEFKPPARGLG